MKLDVKKFLKKPSKKAVILSAAFLLVCAIGGGIWYYVGHNSSDPVYVYPFQYIGMTEYWGDSMESYGPVSTDKIQTVFLSTSQTVTEILVKEGDKVKKGDLLMSFDTTLSDLALEKKRLEVEKLKLDLDDAKAELRRIKGATPLPEAGGDNSGAMENARLRSEQTKKIRDLGFKIKMAEIEYKMMLREVSDGKVYSEIDGTVISLLSEEEAKDRQEPVLKVSGGGGFYVEGAVNELDKDRLQVGQEVTVNDWRNGMTYTGTVRSVSDLPNVGDSWNGSGNPTASYYPFMVFVDESAGLQAGSYASVTYAAGNSENGVYLEKPFVRTENGKSYVLVLGEDGRLEQRFVRTGKALWSSYIEILSGVTADDLIAFPYGKNVKPGVTAIEGDMSNLYG